MRIPAEKSTVWGTHATSPVDGQLAGKLGEIARCRSIPDSALDGAWTTLGFYQGSPKQDKTVLPEGRSTYVLAPTWSILSFLSKPRLVTQVTKDMIHGIALPSFDQ